MIIRWISFPRYQLSGVGYDVGARFGIYLALLAGIAEVAVAAMQLRASGESMPWVSAQQSAPETAAPEPTPPAQPEE